MVVVSFIARSPPDIPTIIPLCRGGADDVYGWKSISCREKAVLEAGQT
jgi:hypothetical protein